jgi:hypothetical protein
VLPGSERLEFNRVDRPANQESAGPVSIGTAGKSVYEDFAVQLVKQRVRVLEVGGVEAFCEPVADSVSIARRVLLALLGEAAAEACCPSQLPGLAVLVPTFPIAMQTDSAARFNPKRMFLGLTVCSSLHLPFESGRHIGIVKPIDGYKREPGTLGSDRSA